MNFTYKYTTVQKMMNKRNQSSILINPKISIFNAKNDSLNVKQEIVIVQRSSILDINNL